MIAACLSSALSLNSCIEEVFPESSTATIDQIGKSDQAISAMVNSVVAFINAFRSYGPQFYHDFGYSGYNLQEPLLMYHESKGDYKKRTLKTAFMYTQTAIYGYKILKIPFHKYVYALKPVIAAILPQKILAKYHRK